MSQQSDPLTRQERQCLRDALFELDGARQHDDAFEIDFERVVKAARALLNKLDTQELT